MQGLGTLTRGLGLESYPKGCWFSTKIKPWLVALNVHGLPNFILKLNEKNIWDFMNTGECLTGFTENTCNYNTENLVEDTRVWGSLGLEA